MKQLLIAVLLLAHIPIVGAADENVRHKVVYQEEGRFAGWPANHGVWSWGDEIVVGFTNGYHKKDPKGGHDIDRSRRSAAQLGRSLDGGETWAIEAPVFGTKGAEAKVLKKPIDFTDPNLAIKFRSGNIFYSFDRCKTWDGPHALPTFGRPKLLARTDYIVEGKHRLTAFIAAAKDNGKEGQPLCIRTTDGGQTWNLVGWLGKQPPAEYGYAIMPATVRVGNTGYFSMIRRGGIVDGKKSWWVEPWVSPNDGQSWYLLNGPRIENSGNPATLTRLKNGDLAMAYGWRRYPYGLRARVSSDDGQTWSDESILRKDGSSWDIGYPRTVQRNDGKCVTMYYYHNSDRPERYIACTIWDPASLP